MGLSMSQPGQQSQGDREGRPYNTRCAVALAHFTIVPYKCVVQCSKKRMENVSMPIAIIVHGGAGTIAPERSDSAQVGCRAAALAGYVILQAGGSALEAVEAAVRSLEDNPEYNAGTGACLGKNGNIELDAGMMDGRALQVGAIAGIERIKNPISLARKVLESEHVLLIGKGAEQFAWEQGIEQCASEELVTERQYQLWLTARDEEEPRYYRRQVGSIPLLLDLLPA